MSHDADRLTAPAAAGMAIVTAPMAAMLLSACGQPQGR